MAFGRVRLAACVLSMLVILVVGLSKFADLPAFAGALRSWSIIPQALVPGIALMVPSIEVSVSLMWLLGLGRSMSAYATLALLLVLTAAYLAQWALGSPPTCGCLGAIARYLGEVETAKAALSRNALLTLGVAAGLAPRSAPGPELATARPTSSRAGTGGRSAGFTLIETILVVMVIGLLVALISPSLAGVRERGKSIRTLANLGSHAKAATMYAGDFKDLAPYATSPTAISIIRCPSRRIALRAKYFEMAYWWNVALADGYYNGDPFSKSFASPFNALNTGGPAGGALGSDYWYSCAFLASPEYYNESQSMAPPIQFRSVRLSEVVFAAKKTLFAEYMTGTPSPPAMGEGGARLPASFVDGHAEWGRPDATLTHRGGDGPTTIIPYAGHFEAAPYPLLHTQDGVRGRDIE